MSYTGGGPYYARSTRSTTAFCGMGAVEILSAYITGILQRMLRAEPSHKEGSSG